MTKVLTSDMDAKYLLNEFNYFKLNINYMWILELENIKCFKSKKFEFEDVGLILVSLLYKSK